MNRILIGVIVIAAAGCSPSQSADAHTPDPGEASIATTPPAANSALPTATANAAIRYVTVDQGNSARYRIREQLVGVDLPNDAVGETKGVTGVIAADKTGKVLSDESKFIIDVTTLKSDKDRRDGFVQRRVLETGQYPTVTFVPTAVRGISLPLPKSGSRTFDMIGNLTVRGATKPTTWKVNAQFAPNTLTGHATTAFTFTDFGIDQPRVPVVLSVGDTIKLELDFSMKAEAGKN
jgi:polyisoprenoid-binding protein YceI